MIHYDEYGTQNDETVVFIHGAGLSGWMWHHQIDDLQQDFHCLVPDLPAHGQNAFDKPFSIRQSVDEISVLIQQQAHNGKAHLVGLSLGATIAIEVLRTHPELINRVLMSAPPSGPFPGTPVMVAMSYFMMPLLRSDFVIRQTANQIKLADTDFKQFRSDQKNMRGTTFRQIAREIHEHRLPVILEKRDIPVLAMVSEHDNSINYRVVRHLVRLMPSAQGCIAPGVGHGWNGENPRLFNQTVCSWLTDGTIHDDLLPLG